MPIRKKLEDSIFLGMSYSRWMKSSATPDWNPQKCIYYMLWCLNNCRTEYGHTHTTVKITVFWDVMVCSLVHKYPYFWEKHLHWTWRRQVLPKFGACLPNHTVKSQNCHVHPSKNLKILTPSPKNHEYQKQWSLIIKVSSPCLSDSCPYRDILMLHSCLCSHL